MALITPGRASDQTNLTATSCDVYFTIGAWPKPSNSGTPAAACRPLTGAPNLRPPGHAGHDPKSENCSGCVPYVTSVAPPAQQNSPQST